MSLAIAFGARGSGRALAHFEPSRNVINLTKMKGAGSLAHEWGHAFDFNVGQLCGCLSMYTRDARYMGSSPIAKAFDSVIHKMKYREKSDAEMLDGAKKEMEEALRCAGVIVSRLEDRLNDNCEKKGILLKLYECKHFKEMFDKLRKLEDVNTTLDELSREHDDIVNIRWDYENRSQLKLLRGKYRDSSNLIKAYEETGSWPSYSNEVYTDFYKGAMGLDASRAKKYYSDLAEMFARCFESYIEDKAKANGFVTQYLVHSTDNGIYKALGLPNCYPEGKERRIINEAIDKLMDAYREEVFKGERTPQNIRDLYTNCGTEDVYAEEKSMQERVKKVVSSGEVNRNSSAEEIQQAVKRVELTTKKKDELSDINDAIALRAYIASKVSGMNHGVVTPNHLYNVLATSGTNVIEMQIPVKQRLGNSASWTVYNGKLAVLASETDAKKCEAVIEAVTRLQLNNISNTNEGKMVIEGVIFTVCKKAGLDVRTYMVSRNFDELARSKGDLKNYLEYVIKYSGNICKMLRV